MYHFLDLVILILFVCQIATSKQPEHIGSRARAWGGGGDPFIPCYEWTGGPNILGALDPGVQVSGGSNYTPTPLLSNRKTSAHAHQSHNHNTTYKGTLTC